MVELVPAWATATIRCGAAGPTSQRPTVSDGTTSSPAR